MKEREEQLYDRYDGHRAIRTWKRDGSRNVMTLAAAALNVEKHGKPKRGAFEAAAMLCAGETLETSRATFRLAMPWEAVA